MTESDFFNLTIIGRGTECLVARCWILDRNAPRLRSTPILENPRPFRPRSLTAPYCLVNSHGRITRDS